MNVIITIKLHFSMVVACFILSEFLKTSLAKLTAFEWKRAKRQVFAPDNYVQTSHSAPFNTYPGIFESTTFLMRIKKNSTSTGIRIQTDSLDSSGNIGSRAWVVKCAKFESCSAFHGKELGKELGSILLRHRLKNSGSSVHKFPDSERIKKFPLWPERIKKVEDS